ncbi:LysM peptidoglycan-binding domain-containing protein [Kordiimonas lipolytica]|uniref:LysM peptidoglycan-binding domain-containing protein n=2 Tax=Kordiimonas lipolytica TaxID=1662421 RepID=A0ABV8U802_9PROT
MMMGGHKRRHATRLSALIVLAFSLSACSTVDKRIIRPVFGALTSPKTKNAPFPVPLPRTKPPVPNRSYAATNTPAQAPRAATSSSATGAVHVVSKGDTLYAISRRYGVPVRDLISNNRLRSPYTLEIGQRVKVPTAQVYVVKKGDTGYSISRRFGVNVSALMRENGIRAPYTLEIGQKLKLPGGASTAPVQTASASSPTVVRPAQTTRRTVARPTPPPRTSSGFDWPVQGRLASRFGPKQDGLHNDGINILARQGTPVKAAETGVVVYASNALEGYGHLLLVKHSGGWITAYAHNERLLVREGQTVDKGQIIARVGNTGGVTEPQLHFEIRKGRRALDPLRYLSQARADAAMTSR